MTGRELDAYYEDQERTRMIAQSLGVEIVKRNRSYHIRCPGHLKRLGKPDNNPSSCKIMPNGGYHCFACGVSRGTRQMVEEILDCTPKEAYEYMAKVAGVELDNLSGHRSRVSGLPTATLNREDEKVLHMHCFNESGEYILTELYKKSRPEYYSLIISRAEEMKTRYLECKAYSSPNAPKAYDVFEMLGDNFDVSIYGKIDHVIDDRVSLCDRIIATFKKAEEYDIRDIVKHN